MDYIRLFKRVSMIHRKSGKSRLWLMRDIIRCGIKYGCGYSDYRLCEFYNLTGEQRATYVTRGINNQIVKLLNDPAYYHLIADKISFNKLFADSIGRAWLDFESASYEDFEAFMSNRETIIIKPRDEMCGVGVEKLNRPDFGSLREMYDYIRAANASLVEECIVQHPDIAVIYPHSVNTLRIVTVLKDGEAHVVYSYIRLGNGGRAVDNINAGGMTAPVDLDAGTIKYAAFDKDSVYYDTHPMTGTVIAGRKIPFWHEAMEMCRLAAKRIPQLGYVGWDAAITRSGPVLIEANHFPGHDFLQMPPHVPDKIGMLPRFKEFVDL